MHMLLLNWEDILARNVIAMMVVQLWQFLRWQLTCIPGHCGYAASKAALDAIVQVMSKEFSRRKIRVNAILPTYVDTPLLRGDMENTFDLQGRIEANQPFGIIDPRYLAYLVEFLISDKAKYITGTLIPVTAGCN